MYQRTNLNIIQGENLNVGDNVYFLFLREYVILGSVIDVYVTR